MARTALRVWRLLLMLLIFSEQVPAAGRPPLHVIISVDTETSAGCGPPRCVPVPIEDGILGVHDGRYYGIDDVLANFHAALGIGQCRPARRDQNTQTS